MEVEYLKYIPDQFYQQLKEPEVEITTFYSHLNVLNNFQNKLKGKGVSGIIVELARRQLKIFEDEGKDQNVEE